LCLDVRGKKEKLRPCPLGGNLPYPDGGGDSSSGGTPSGKRVRLPESSSLQFTVYGDELAIGKQTYFITGELLIEKLPRRSRNGGLSARDPGNFAEGIRNIQIFGDTVNEKM
jgi:hypothetical protein